jgi:predicted nucleic acid-binding protein
MNQLTLFNKQLVVFDAMVLINFHGLYAFDKLINWAYGDIVIEKRVKNETTYSKAGEIEYEQYIAKGAIIEKTLKTEKHKNLFSHYLNKKIKKKIIDKGEAACLALAISEDFGIASDEKVVRQEFSRRCPGSVCVHSWGIVDMAVSLKLISKRDGDDLKRGFYYV